MGPLKMEISSEYQNYAKTITGSLNFVTGLQETEFTFNVESKL